MKAVKAVLALFSISICSLANSSTPLIMAKGYGINFNNAMISAQKPIGSNWQLVETLYKKHVVDAPLYLEQRIPKIIHQIWLGSPLPEVYKKLQESWIKNHPDWEYKLWTDKDIEKLKLVNKEIYEATQNYGAKSDIARYEILYRFGGLYVDMDFECLQPFDIFHRTCDFYTGIIQVSRLQIGNALIGAIPNHPLLKECITSLKFAKIAHAHSGRQIQKTTGPILFTKIALKYMSTCSQACVAFPPGYFYPWPHTQRKNNKPEQIRQWIHPETFAIHHWHYSWKPEKSRRQD